MFADPSYRYLTQRNSCTPLGHDAHQTISFNFVEMEAKAREFTKEEKTDFVLTSIYDILRDTDFQKDTSYYVDCWEQKRISADKPNATQDKTFGFFKENFPVKLSFNMQEMEAKVRLIANENTRKYLISVLNSPEFKRDPQAYIRTLKKSYREPDEALLFLEKHFPEESFCIIC